MHGRVVNHGIDKARLYRSCSSIGCVFKVYYAIVIKLCMVLIDENDGLWYAKHFENTANH